MGAVFLARSGITGPIEVLEGTNGLMEAMGEKPKIEWSKEDLDLVTRVSIKKYNAEAHSQSTLEGILEIREHQALRAEEIDKIDIIVFKQAFNIIGEGKEAGDKHDVHTKEQADHSLPYLVAVAILDGEVTPKQFLPDRINRDDVQTLLKKVHVGTQAHIGKKAFDVLDTYTARYPEEMPVKITVKLKDGQELVCEQSDYHGFFSSPMTWDEVVKKFDTLAEPYADASLRHDIRDAVDTLQDIRVTQLTELLAKVRGSV
jgi:2-methylcitrate dehydratase